VKRAALLLALLATTWFTTPIHAQDPLAQGEGASIEFSEGEAFDGMLEEDAVEFHPKKHWLARLLPDVEWVQTTDPAAFDLGVLLVLLISGTVLIRRHCRQKWIYVNLLAGLLYFGFWRRGCVCPIGSTSNLTIAIAHPEEFVVSIYVVGFFLLPLLFAFLFGRIFCGTVCPLGAIQQIISIKTIRLPKWLNTTLGLGRFVVLGLGLWLAIEAMACLFCAYDPFLPIFQLGGTLLHKAVGVGSDMPLQWAGSMLLWGLGIAALGLGLIFPRPVCRWLCPYGVLLGLFSWMSFWHRDIKSNCVSCALCETPCPTQAITAPKLDKFNCISCGQCSDACKLDAIQ
jgi:polyferredoxin